MEHTPLCPDSDLSVVCVGGGGRQVSLTNAALAGLTSPMGEERAVDSTLEAQSES